ncbi:MAG: FG-GAP-like repeat-containing protein [Bacteroidota bacterium]
MRIFLSFVALAVLLGGCASAPPMEAQAQASFSPDDFQRTPTPFPVELDGADLPVPFTGGFWAPVPQLVDLTGDGIADLAVAVGGAGIGVFENAGGEWIWRTGALDGIRTGPWFRFVDVDADGDPDLFTRGTPGRVRYFENVGTASEPILELRADPLLAVGGSPVQIEDTTVPSWGDGDGDGDPDIIAGKADLGTITYYRLDGMENSIPQYDRITENWEGIQIFEGQPQCVETISANGFPSPLGRPTRHGANATAFVDIENGGGPELIWGDFFTERLFYFLNVGTAEDPDLDLVTQSYPMGEGTPGAQNAPAFGDTDGDGDLDLLVGVLGGLCVSPVTGTNNLVFFENTGTPTSPDFSRETTQLIRGIDEGRRSVPALADIDADGDLDLVVGDGNTDANLALYRNEGSATAPRFVMEDADWLGLEYDFGGYAPVFGDIDGDGDLDLLVGGFNGRMAYLENTGTATSGTWELRETRFGGIDAGQYSRPTLADIDGDGDLDLAIGESNGRVFLYRNIGSASAPEFETKSNGQPEQADLNFRDAIGLPGDVGQESSPALADLDGDGDLDALVGTSTGQIQLYRNTGTATAPMFESVGEVNAERLTTTPRAADLSGDGVPDILSGADSGGLLYWTGTLDVSVAPGPAAAPSIVAFPNPSTGEVRLSFGRQARGDLIVRDVRGREIRRLLVSDDTATWDGLNEAGEAVPAGVYLVGLAEGETVRVTLAR